MEQVKGALICNYLKRNSCLAQHVATVLEVKAVVVFSVVSGTRSSGGRIANRLLVSHHGVEDGEHLSGIVAGSIILWFASDSFKTLTVWSHDSFNFPRGPGISISAFALLSVKNRQAELLEARAVEAEISRIITEQQIRLNKKPGELLILRTNETYSHCSALLHGDVFTAGVFATEIDALCPSQAYFINRFDWVYYQGTQVAIHDLPWDILVARTWVLADNPSWKQEKIVEYPHNIYLVIHEEWER